jgi:hypothetical protein
MNVDNQSISYEETSSLIKRCAQEKTNKEIAQTIGVAESRISEGKKGKWRLRQAQKDKLINEFGFEQLHKGRYLVVQRTKCFETMLTAIKTYDLIIKTEEYFTSEPFKAFLTDINIDALLEHSTSKDWFAHISQHQDNILSHVTSRSAPDNDTLSEILGSQKRKGKEDLQAIKLPPICINRAAEHDLDSLPKYIDDQQEYDENSRSMFNLCKNYYEGGHHEYEHQFWTQIYLLCYLKTQSVNVADLLSLSHDKRSETSSNEIVICGRTVWKRAGRFDLHENQLINSLVNESWQRQNLQGDRLKIDLCNIEIELLITESSRYFLLVNIYLPPSPEKSKQMPLQHNFLTEEINKSKIVDELIAICDLCGIKQDTYETRRLLAEEGALISTAEYIY